MTETTTDREVEAPEEIDPEFTFTQFDGLTAIELVRRLDEWQQRKDRLDAELKQVNKVFDHLRMARIPQAFDDDGISLLRVDGVGRCSLTADMFVSIAKGRRDEAYEWLRDTGRQDLITETINASTLKAVIKKAKLSGEELPEGAFNVTPFTRASITRA